VNEGVNISPRGQITLLGAKFAPRGEVHHWGPGVKLKMALRYFRSGVEMLRMADTYYNEGNFEKAYTLYHKYVTLFVEKVGRRDFRCRIVQGSMLQFFAKK
jgi:hypothetical protein